MGSHKPVIINQFMTAGTESFRELRHDAGAVVCSVFIVVTYHMAIITSIIFAVVKYNVGMGKAGLAVLFTPGH